jgi:ATP-dependent Clp protease ATP-binding subunit ClpX
MNPRNAYCSFCRKSYEDVGPLVEGPGDVYICSECVSLCQSIIDQEKRRRNITSAGPAAFDSKSVRGTLDRLIAKQEYAKAVLSEAACRRHEGKGRVLLIGPSQSSAMFLAKAVAFALEVPFAAGDWSGLATTGKGNVFYDLLAAADFDIESAKHGVVYVRGIERPEAQDLLSRLWQKNVSTPVDGLSIEVGGVLFVCGATFAGLDEAIVELGRHPEQLVTVESLKAVGARPEWAAALEAIARVSPLEEESLERIVIWIDFRRV